MDALPPLPAHPDGLLWSPAVQDAYTAISEAYTRAQQLLNLDDTDPLRMRFHLERLRGEMIPILLAMEEEALHSPNGVPMEWLEAMAVQLGSLVAHLVAAVEGTEQRCASVVCLLR